MQTQDRQLTVIIKGPARAKVNEAVTFNARIVDGIEPFTYEWSGIPNIQDLEAAPESTKIGKFPLSGSHMVSIKVKDGSGMIGEDSFIIYID